jgi:hypothetical protein
MLYGVFLSVAIAFIGLLFLPFIWEVSIGLWGSIVIASIVNYIVVIKPQRTWRMELYESRFKIFFRGDLLQNATYSEIGRIEKRSFPLTSKRPVLYGKDNKLLAIIPSNPKIKELGGLSVFDWLKGRVNQSIQS